MDAILVQAIRTGCWAAEVHLACSYPDCGCKNLPTAIIAALAYPSAGEIVRLNLAAQRETTSKK